MFKDFAVHTLFGDRDVIPLFVACGFARVLLVFAVCGYAIHRHLPHVYETVVISRAVLMVICQILEIDRARPVRALTQSGF